MDRSRTINVKGAAFHKQTKDNLQLILDYFMAIINLIKVEKNTSNSNKRSITKIVNKYNR